VLRTEARKHDMLEKHVSRSGGCYAEGRRKYWAYPGQTVMRGKGCRDRKERLGQEAFERWKHHV
jgi:hypothetical protein